MIMAPSLGVERGSHLGHDVKRDGGQDFLEQSTRHHHLGHLEGNRPAMPDDLRADLHQPVA
jgi:hypothetical protein